MDNRLFESVRLWDGLNELIREARWTEFMGFALSVNERLCREFLSSLRVG